MFKIQVFKRCPKCGEEKPATKEFWSRRVRWKDLCSETCLLCRSPQDRFWKKVNKNGPTPAHRPALGRCWAWKAGVNHRGYGKFWTNGRTVGAHRFSWELHFGPIGIGKRGEGGVLHSCDNPSCVNPKHLFIGDHATNMEDRNRKLRQAAGERQGLSKLTDSKVAEIRARYALGETQRALARSMGVDQAAVLSVLKRRTWKHVL